MTSKWLFAVPLLIISLFSCTNGADDISNLKAIGGARYGGYFRFMSSEKIESLFPLESTSVYSQRISSQIFDPILKLDEAGSKVIPAIAEKYEVSDDGKTYTLTIRKGVYFHEDDCIDGGTRELNAEDVKNALDVACSGLKMNQIAYIIKDKIDGGDEYFKATASALKAGGVSGITTSGNYTVKINLVEAFAGFDKLLTYSGFGVFPKEAMGYYKNEISKHPVGTGPFKLKSYTNDGIELERNGNYWDKDEFGNALPFLAGIQMTYAKDKRSELKAFRNQEIDLVLEIPSEEVDNILGSLQEAQDGKTVKHKVDSKPSFSVSFLVLSQVSPELKDVRVRQAFYHAINRQELVDVGIQGDGYPVEYGFIPSTPFYPAERVKGVDYNVTKAKGLLAAAGFADGKGFPTIDIYVSGKEGSTRHLMAKDVAKQLKANLNINATVKLVSFDERNNLVAEGKASVWLSGWVADYPDGESFLSLFQGKYAGTKSSFLNPFMYKNSKFDALYAKVNRELNEKKRTELMVQCDQIITNDAVVVPLTNDDFITMINSRIRNFTTNSLEAMNFAKLYVKEPKDGDKAEN